MARLVSANDTSARGVNVVFAIANLRVVKTCMACCANVRGRRRLGIAAGAAGAGMTSARFLGDTRSTGVRIGGLIIFGTAPGVLFRVTRWCKRGVFLRVHFAVGFHARKIGGAFVMHGTSRTVMMGVLSITLCCCICILLYLTLCSSKAIVGFKIFLLFVWMCLISPRPFCVALKIAVDLANLSVSTQKY